MWRNASVALMVSLSNHEGAVHNFAFIDLAKSQSVVHCPHPSTGSG
jgi:hypothetical protein